MNDSAFDVVILGSGPAGFYGALSCAARGYKTVVVENDAPGGTGFRWGALPVKGGLDLFRYNAGFINSSDLHQAFKGRMDRAKSAEKRVKERLEEKGVELLIGEPEIISPRLIRVESRDFGLLNLSCRYLVLASGTEPAAPPGFVLDGKTCLTHKDLLFAGKLPQRLEVLGGNVEGIEIAFLFAGLHIPVRVTEAEAAILPDMDPELTEPLRKRMESMGVVFRIGYTASSVSDMSADCTPEHPVLITGLRKPVLPRGINLLQPEMENGFLLVNESLETSISGVFAIGDVNGLHGMAHVAIQQGIHLVKGFTGGCAVRNYRRVPRAVFTVPEIAGVGIQENEIDEPSNYEIIRINLTDTWRGFIRGEEGFIKIILGPEGVLEGIWGVGREISEILSGFSLLVGKHIRAEEIHDTLFIHPSLSEAALEAAIGKGL